MRVGLALGVLEDLEEPGAQPVGVDRRVEREGVLLGAGRAEEVRSRAGGQHEVVGRERVARVVVTVRASRSTETTSSWRTTTVGDLWKMPRNGRAMSTSASSAVATWYSSGWNWWKLFRSISVTAMSCFASSWAHPTPAKPPPTTTTEGFGASMVVTFGFRGLDRLGRTMPRRIRPRHIVDVSCGDAVITRCG